MQFWDNLFIPSFPYGRGYCKYQGPEDRRNRQIRVLFPSPSVEFTKQKSFEF